MIDIMFCCQGAKSLKERWLNKKDYNNHWRVKTNYRNMVSSQENPAIAEPENPGWFALPIKEETSYISIVNSWNPNIEIDKTEYDILYNRVGQKFELIKNFLNNEFNDFQDVRYIGFVDEDLYLSKYDLVDACNYAYQKDMKVFQIAVDENTQWHFQAFKHDNKIEWTRVSWVEQMWPFMTVDAAMRLKDYLNYANPKNGWGMDHMFEHILQEKLYVLHNWKMQHPPAPQTYSVDEGKEEFATALTVYGPKFLKDKYNINYSYDATYKIYHTQYKDGTVGKEQILTDLWPEKTW